ncbi:hypothetical protein L484_024504 [Morus notabilis]|uniref:Uncharacterized protein n=1 Tax=Morus notabilis TaxID=981085 RepID=W9RHK0_9ROSA|nr:hypothetical protein L484_024504 [Morus notabilis]
MENDLMLTTLKSNHFMLQAFLKSRESDNEVLSATIPILSNDGLKMLEVMVKEKLDETLTEAESRAVFQRTEHGLAISTFDAEPLLHIEKSMLKVEGKLLPAAKLMFGGPRELGGLNFKTSYVLPHMIQYYPALISGVYALKIGLAPPLVSVVGSQSSDFSKFKALVSQDTNEPSRDPFGDLIVKLCESFTQTTGFVPTQVVILRYAQQAARKWRNVVDSSNLMTCESPSDIHVLL